MSDENKYTKKLQPRKIIKCPHCGWEYLPGEVLYPTQVLGQPKNNIIRDPLGHILYEEYRENDEPLAEDKFVCENCGKPFVIEIDVNYKSKPEEAELDFSTETVSLW